MLIKGRERKLGTCCIAITFQLCSGILMQKITVYQAFSSQIFVNGFKKQQLVVIENKYF